MYRTHYNKFKKIRMMGRESPGPSICALVVQYRLRDSGNEMLASSWRVRSDVLTVQLPGTTVCTVGTVGTAWYGIAYGITVCLQV
jgi:hypothetical protein